ncbi:MAG TPA: 1-acyl-sn-glycerol-3-phosphate acyltransferase [Bacillota bacterium]|nr:1-acyl-sn-glycerol-3-phosphate acyltransferase [Bacillota bacterium]
MSAPPVRQKWFLRPVVWALTLPDVKKHKTVINRINTEGLKPPYILLCNHNAFFDFKVATRAIFPNRANYIVAIDGFIGREWLLRSVGGICKRKFTNDIRLVYNIKKAIKHNDILIIYPEARYSLCGTNAVLPNSLGMMCKIMRVPVVTLICHGHHIDSPFWNLRKRGVKGTTADFKQLFTADELSGLTAAQIDDAIAQEFKYDDFAWQKENGVRVNVPWRAEGLHKVLYKCPACGTEYRMSSDGTTLFCAQCGKRWHMTELGELEAESGATEFSHIPDWYEWERAEVKKEIEDGKYSFTAECHVDSLPNANGYIRIGEGTLKHDETGFHLKCTGEKCGDLELDIAVPSLYSCHIEYEYLDKYGDCIDLSTLEDSYYIYPHGIDFSVTKLALATEELYSRHVRLHPKAPRIREKKEIAFRN